MDKTEIRKNTLIQEIKIKEDTIKMLELFNESQKDTYEFHRKMNKKLIALGVITLSTIMIVFELTIDKLNSFNVFSISLMVVTIHKSMFDLINDKYDNKKKTMNNEFEISSHKLELDALNRDLTLLEETKNAEE